MFMGLRNKLYICDKNHPAPTKNQAARHNSIKNDCRTFAMLGSAGGGGGEPSTKMKVMEREAPIVVSSVRTVPSVQLIALWIVCVSMPVSVRPIHDFCRSKMMTQKATMTILEVEDKFRIFSGARSVGIYEYLKSHTVFSGGRFSRDFMDCLNKNLF